MNWTWVGIFGVLIIGATIVVIALDPFRWRDSEVPALKAKIDSLLTENAEYKRQNEQLTVNWKNCEASKDTHHVPVIVRKVDNEAYNYVLGLLQMKDDSIAILLAAQKLSRSIWTDNKGSVFEDEYFHLKVRASGVNYPMTGNTDVFYSFSEYTRKKNEVVYVDKPALPYEWKFFNGFRVRGDLSAQFTPLDIDGEFELSMPLGIVENWRLIPNIGISTLQDFNAGIGLEWGLFVPQ